LGPNVPGPVVIDLPLIEPHNVGKEQSTKKPLSPIKPPIVIKDSLAFIGLETHAVAPNDVAAGVLQG
jgi:hypothetical protein